MPQQDAYREWLKKDLGGLIEELNLSELQGHSLRSRWLDQVLWMESKAKKSQTMYYIVRPRTREPEAQRRGRHGCRLGRLCH